MVSSALKSCFTEKIYGKIYIYCDCMLEIAFLLHTAKLIKNSSNWKPLIVIMHPSLNVFSNLNSMLFMDLSFRSC